MKNIPKTQLIASSLTALTLIYLVKTPESASGLYLTRGFFDLVIFAAMVTSIFRAYRRYKRKDKASAIPLILTPVVAAVISVYGLFFLNNIDEKAKKLLWETAIQIQKTSRENGKVPSSIEGWKKYDAWHRREFKVGATAYNFFYDPLPERNEFLIGINYGPDARFVLTGGVDKAVARP